ncbi:MAG: aminoacyl-tRNA hydrolase [Cyclobacteriaceae bacterium]|nr:aminoacyl-tRNA hydrolase [Cyclobacteriaceae bacterium]
MKFLIVGLGNIGAEYELTRHNIGFLINDYLADEAKTSFETAKLAAMASYKHKGKSIYLIKPATYMNLSGKAVNYWMQHLGIPVERTLIITDDIALPLGKLRMRPKGSSAGHNGLKNIEGYLGQDYIRLRVGIGSNFGKGQQVDYVLSRFEEEEMTALPGIIKKAGEAVLSFCTLGLERTMNFHNN